MPATASQRAAERSGFTLLEVLVTIAIIALLTGVLAVGTNRLLSDRPKSADELFWAAVAAAKKDALFNNRDVRLAFDAKTQQFVITADGVDGRLPFVPKDVAEFDFLAPRSPGLNSAILVGGDLVETNTITSVIFFRDGTCSPFRAQLKSRLGTRVLDIDPWTCAPMLVAQPNAR